SSGPVFDRGGKYLYFISSPNAGISEYGWGVLQGEFARPLVTRRLHVVLLQEGEPFPMTPIGPNPEAKIDQPVNQPRIDFENIGQRIIDLPQQLADYGLLATGKPGKLYLEVNEWPKSPNLGAGPNQSIYLYDLSKANKLEKLVEDKNSSGFDVS